MGGNRIYGEKTRVRRLAARGATALLILCAVATFTFGVAVALAKFELG